MAWNDPATPNQIALLGQEYLSFALTAASEAREMGASVKGDLIEDLACGELINDTIRKYNRLAASKAISELPCYGNLPSSEIWKAIAEKFNERDLDIDAYYTHYLENDNTVIMHQCKR